MFKLITFLLITLVTSSAVFSQTISSQLYENEEDLEEGLLSGELTYQEYIELLELLREGVTSDSSQKERLLFLPDLSLSEIQLSSDSTGDVLRSNKDLHFHPLINIFFLPAKLNQTNGRFSFQIRQRFDREYSYNFILTEFRLKDKFLFNLQMQKENSSDPHIRKRSLELQSILFQRRIVLGNFDKKIGLGLNIGYHPLLRTEEQSEENSFLYPLYGRYNGLLIESKFDFFYPELIFSRNKKGNLSEELWGLNLLFSHRGWGFGFLRSEGELKNSLNSSSFYNRNLSFYLKVKKMKFSFSTEYSILNNNGRGWASILTLKNQPFLLELSGWSYTQDFLHLFGSGPSNPDYTYINIDEVDYEYPSREIGEKGFLLKSDYALLRNFSLDFSYSQWKENPVSPFKLRQKIGLKGNISEKIKAKLEYLYSDSDLEEEGYSQNLFSSTFIFEPQEKSSFRLITRYGERKLTSSQRKSFELQLRSDLEWFSPFLFTLWTRYKDNNLSSARDGFWDFRVRESFPFFKGSFFWSEYFIQLNSATRDKSQGIKLRLEVGF